MYPVHGVAEVVALEKRDIGGDQTPVYILKILDTGLKIMVPTVNAGSVGLRDLIASKQVKEVYEILKSRDIPRDTQTWNRRYREYMEKIKTGSVFEIAEVLRDLCVLRATKELSFGERKMLDTARGLLIKELALAKGVGEDKITPRSTRSSRPPRRDARHHRRGRRVPGAQPRSRSRRAPSAGGRPTTASPPRSPTTSSRSPCTFQTRRTYCCMEPGCHLPLHEGKPWPRFHAVLEAHGIVAPSRLRLALIGIVEPGARFFDPFQPDPAHPGEYVLRDARAQRYTHRSEEA